MSKLATIGTVLCIGLLCPVAAFAATTEDGKAAFSEGRYEEALKTFGENLAEGDAESVYYMARMLELGLGVPADKTAAFQLYSKTAEAGHIASLNRVALMHYRGEEGVVQDYAKAAEYFMASAELGDANAAFNLGKLYFAGQGVDKDVSKALAYFQNAADQDHILALNTLGALQRDGAKSEEDVEQAKAYFARSAAYGNAVGLFETARMILLEGTESEQLIEAHMHLNLAAARSHPNAPSALQELTAIMSVEDVEAAQEKAKAFVARGVDQAE